MRQTVGAAEFFGIAGLSAVQLEPGENRGSWQKIPSRACPAIRVHCRASRGVAFWRGNRFEEISIYGATRLESRPATVLSSLRIFPEWREARSMLILKSGSVPANGLKNENSNQNPADEER